MKRLATAFLTLMGAPASPDQFLNLQAAAKDRAGIGGQARRETRFQKIAPPFSPTTKSPGARAPLLAKT